MIKSVIFDLDGTLLDTLKDLQESVSYAFEFYGFEGPSQKQVREALGEGPYVLMQRLGAKNPEGFVETFKKHYKDNLNRYTKAYTGIPGLLDELEKRQITMSVLSNKPHEALIKVCEIYFPERFLDVLGSDAGFARKPNPDSLIYLIERMGKDSTEVLYVGDSSVDILTAKKARCKGLQVSWGYGDLVKDVPFITEPMDLLFHL